VSSEFDEEVKEVNEPAVEQWGAWCGGGLATIVGASMKSSKQVEGVIFTPIDEEIDVENQHKVHIILHKLTGDIVKEKGGEESARLQCIRSIVKANPQTRIVDPIESVGIVVSRLETNERIATLLEKMGKDKNVASGLPLFYQPSFAVVREANEDALRIMMDNNLRFPVICKPERACGVAESHAMNIVLSEHGFADIPRPYVMQQYWNHGAILHKVYVIGEYVMMFQRPSLPDFFLARAGDEEGDISASSNAAHVIPFDSRKPYPDLINYNGRGICVQDVVDLDDMSDECCREKCDSRAEATARRDENLSSSQKKRIEEVASVLSESFGLSLFGFDVIVSSDSTTHEENLFIVDVNFFPSYKEVPNFPKLLRAHLRKSAGLPPWTSPIVDAGGI
jgi:inositol-1,3,4-trisphosphate 5/6-kinase/inositol-tetrakisphosphate 1-kinase